MTDIPQEQQPRRQIRTSQDVLDELARLNGMLHFAVQELRRLDRVRLNAIAAYEVKKADVYVHADGTERHRAELTRLQTAEEWIAMEEAKSDHRTQKVMIDALAKEVESMRSVGTTLRAEMNLGGQGAFGR